MKLVHARVLEGGGFAMSFEPRDEEERARVRAFYKRMKKQLDERGGFIYCDTDTVLDKEGS